MKTAVIALTKNGVELAAKISAAFGAAGYGPAALLDAGTEDNRAAMRPIEGDFQAFVGKLFGEYRALIFIMACGIVVRSIVPYLKGKTVDPAVVVSDEKGKYVISLLSGHWGGANQLAREIAQFTKGQPVVTTATDVNGVLAFDAFARDSDCALENGSVLKEISSLLVNGGRVHLFTDCHIAGEYPPYLVPGQETDRGKYAVVLSNSTALQPQFEHVLYIRPRNLIVGIGCKKGTSQAAIAASLANFLEQHHKSPLSLKRLASIDLKADEAGIVDYCRENDLPYLTLPVERIQAVEDRFHYSPFVKQAVGVGGVAEACAVLGGENTRLAVPKTIYPGLTLALAEEEKVYQL